MQRPRWHDAVMAIAIGLVVVGGAVIFWGGDLLRALGMESKAKAAEIAPAPAVPGAT